MKMKSKNQSSQQSRRISQSYDSRLKTSLRSSFKSRFRVFRFSLLAFCFLPFLTRLGISSEQLDPTVLLLPHLAKLSQDVNAPDVPALPNTPFCDWEPAIRVAELPSGPQETQTGDTASVNFAAQVEQNLPQTGFAAAGKPDSLGRKLWQDGISVPQGEKDKRSRNKLKRIIEEIRSVEFDSRDQTPKPVIVVEPMPAAEPDETLSDTEVLEEHEKKEIESGQEIPLLYQPVTDQTLQMLENLSQHLDQVDNPFELGEVLFLSGHQKKAAVFYQEALSRSSADEAGSAQDRAWILFQIGNCLRDDDDAAAKKMYRQLIAEYPESPWTDLAKAQDKLIDWYRENKSRKLIAESKY